MDLRNLELFLHLADSLHFGKSADAMAVSPSTLSRAIQRLEQKTGCVLFERDNRSVRLTPAGEAAGIWRRPVAGVASAQAGAQTQR